MSIALSESQYSDYLGTNVENVYTTPSAGDLLVLTFNLDGLNFTVVSVTDNNGNTWAQVPGAYSTGDATSTDIWYAKNANAGATTILITISSSVGGASAFYRFSGVDTTSPFDSANNLFHVPGYTAYLSAPVTPSISGEVIVTCLYQHGSSMSGVNSPYTDWQGDGTFGASNAIYIAPPASVVSQAHFSPDPGTDLSYNSSSVVFKPAGGGPDPAIQTSSFLVF